MFEHFGKYLLRSKERISASIMNTTSLNDSTGDPSAEGGAPDISLPLQVRFWLLLVFEIPGLACTIFLLYHLIMDRHLRKAIHNHVVVLFLCSALLTELIDIPSYLTFSRIGRVWPENEWYCKLWWFVNVGVFLMTSILMAFASIERHILVFYDKLVSSPRRRFIFHYLPIILILIYGFTFYIAVIFFPSCEQLYDYTQPWCSFPCYLTDPILSMYDSIGNSVISIILTIIFSVALLARVIYQKRRMRQPIHWRKHRKITIQLLSIVSLYLFINLPLPILIVAHLCGVPPDVGLEVQLYTYFLCYFISLLLPYVCLGSLPEVRKKIGMISSEWRTKFQQTATISPTTAIPLT